MLVLTTQPDRPDELERVEAAGGRVINWNGYRVLGVLATSRSIGKSKKKPNLTLAAHSIGICKTYKCQGISNFRRLLPEAVRERRAGGEGGGEDGQGRVPDPGERRAVGRGDQRDGVRGRPGVLPEQRPAVAAGMLPPQSRAPAARRRVRRRRRRRRGEGGRQGRVRQGVRRRGIASREARDRPAERRQRERRHRGSPPAGAVIRHYYWLILFLLYFFSLLPS